jgi:hypothetical protein
MATILALAITVSCSQHGDPGGITEQCSHVRKGMDSNAVDQIMTTSSFPSNSGDSQVWYEDTKDHRFLKSTITWENGRVTSISCGKPTSRPVTI